MQYESVCLESPLKKVIAVLNEKAGELPYERGDQLIIRRRTYRLDDIADNASNLLLTTCSEDVFEKIERGAGRQLKAPVHCYNLDKYIKKRASKN